jgi:hypothetical protein
MNLGLKRGRKLSLSLDHEVTADCINRALEIGDKSKSGPVMAQTVPRRAKKAAIEPSNSCESSQSPCNVAGLRAC